MIWGYPHDLGNLWKPPYACFVVNIPPPCPVSMNAAPPRTTSPPLVAVAKMLRKFASLGEPLDALRWKRLVFTMINWEFHSEKRTTLSYSSIKSQFLANNMTIKHDKPLDFWAPCFQPRPFGFVQGWALLLRHGYWLSMGFWSALFFDNTFEPHPFCCPLNCFFGIEQIKGTCGHNQST